MTTILSHPVGELATRPVVTVDATATLRQATHELWVENVGAAVVERDGRPAGIVSERDVVGALAQGADPDETLVEAVMTADVLVAHPHDRVLTAVIDMVDREIRHLPVYDDAGRCLGVVSMREVVRPMLVDALESRD